MIKNFVINNSQGMHREIVLHAHKVMKKIQLTHYLFNQLRSSDGLQIISEVMFFINKKGKFALSFGAFWRRPDNFPG